MEFEVKESVSLEDGKHDGVIDKIEYRTDPYKYTDIYVKEAKTGFELKYGVPTNSNIDSKMMQLIKKFIEVKPGLKLDPEKVLIGKEVTFMTMTEESKDGRSYARIVDNSIKPKTAVTTETVN